jgi:hypothetical protein
MVRDGVSRPRGKITPHFRSRQLIEIVSAIPLDYWTDRWSVSPEEIISAVPATRWKRTLTTAFTNAAERQQNQTWAEAIFLNTRTNTRTGKLISLFSSEKCEELVDRFYHEGWHNQSIKLDNPLLGVLRYWQNPWPEPLARRWVSLIEGAIRDGNREKQSSAVLRSIIRVFAFSLPPRLAPLVEQKLLPAAGSNPDWQSTITPLLTTLYLRRDMLAVIHQGQKKEESI